MGVCLGIYFNVVTLTPLISTLCVSNGTHHFFFFSFHICSLCYQDSQKNTSILETKKTDLSLLHNGFSLIVSCLD
jgi:hypothetical protein